jgi:integrase/recombinase XerD
MTDGPTNERLLTMWAAYRRAAGCSEKSIREELVLLNAMARRTGCTFLEVSMDELLADMSRPHLAPSSKQNARGVFSRFFDWVEDRGFRTNNPAKKLPRVRVPRREPNPFTADDVLLLVRSLYTRQRLWVLMYAYGGMRSMEIANLRGDSIDLDRGTILIHGKGGVTVTRPLHALIRAELEHYADRFPTGPGTGYLFPMRELVDGKPVPISPKTVSNTLRKSLVRTGLSAKGHRVHDLRKFFATSMIDAGNDIYTVSQAMRHASPATTARHYIRPNESLIRTAMESIPTIDVPRTSSRDEEVRVLPAAWRAPVTMWRARMRAERLSPATMRDRASIIRMLADLVDNPTDVTAEHIRDLVRSAQSDGTARNYGLACTAFFGFLHRHGLIDTDPSVGASSRLIRARGAA